MVPGDRGFRRQKRTLVERPSRPFGPLAYHIGRERGEAATPLFDGALVFGLRFRWVSKLCIGADIVSQSRKQRHNRRRAQASTRGRIS